MQSLSMSSILFRHYNLVIIRNISSSERREKKSFDLPEYLIFNIESKKSNLSRDLTQCGYIRKRNCITIMVKTIFLIIMLSNTILQIKSASVDVPGKSLKRYIDHLKQRHPDDRFSLVRRINLMVQILMKMTKLEHGQKQDKNKIPTSVNHKFTKSVDKMYRRYY